MGGKKNKPTLLVSEIKLQCFALLPCCGIYSTASKPGFFFHSVAVKRSSTTATHLGIQNDWRRARNGLLLLLPKQQRQNLKRKLIISLTGKKRLGLLIKGKDPHLLPKVAALPPYRPSVSDFASDQNTHSIEMQTSDLCTIPSGTNYCKTSTFPCLVLI